MLTLSHITKDYLSGENTVHALRDVSMDFGRAEFVSILGPSGCGKTTLLNIIGGLDRYTSGELSVTGVQLRPSATVTGTRIATTPSALCSRATTSSPTRPCSPTWSWR